MYVKGVAIPIVTLIVMVAIAAISIFLISQAISPVKSLIENVFGGFFGIRKLSLAEKAILCSYYRCIEGCEGANTLKYCKPFTTMNGIHYCDDIIPKDERKICGWNAFQFPIETEVSNQIIEKDRLREVANCIFSEKTKGGLNWWEVAQRLIPLWNVIKTLGDISSGSKIVLITENLANNIERETCRIGATDFSNSIKKAMVKGYTYTFTVDNTICLIPWLNLVCKPAYYTEVSDKSPYIIFKEIGDSKEKIFEKNLFHRISVRADERFECSLKISPHYFGVYLANLNFSFSCVSLPERAKGIETEKKLGFCKDAYISLPTYKPRFIKLKLIGFKEGEKSRVEVFYTNKYEWKFIPPDKDSLTERGETKVLWYGKNIELRADNKVGEYSIYVESDSRTFPGIALSICLGGVSEKLNLNTYKSLHFWFKADKTLKPLKITLYNEGKIVRVCNVNYEVRNTWKKFDISFGECEKIRDEEKVDKIYFESYDQYYRKILYNAYFDGLYFSAE